MKVVKGLRAQGEVLRSVTTQLDNNFARVSSALNTINGRLDTNESDIAAIQATLTAMADAIRDLDTRVTALEAAP